MYRSACQRVFPAAQTAWFILPYCNECMAASDKIFKILDLPEPQAEEKTLPDGALDVTLKDVHFSYEEDREILKGINLNLPAGSFVSLVGESGCGKSTIAGILAAKNRGYAGEITIGGVPLNEVNETNLMQRSFAELLPSEKAAVMGLSH